MSNRLDNALRAYARAVVFNGSSVDFECAIIRTRFELSPSEAAKITLVAKMVILDEPMGVQ